MIKKILFIILASELLFGALGDVLDLAKSTESLGAGEGVSSLTPFAYNVFVENPSRICFENYTSIQYTHLNPAAYQIMYDLPGRHFTGNFSGEIPMFRYWALGINYVYSSYSDDVVDFFGGTRTSDTGTVNRFKILTFAPTLAVRFSSHPKIPKGLKNKELNERLKEETFSGRYSSKRDIDRGIFKVPVSLGVGVSYLYYNFHNASEPLRDGDSSHGALIHFGGTIGILDRLDFTLYLNNLAFKGKNHVYKDFESFIPFQLGTAIYYSIQLEKLDLYFGAGYKIPQKNGGGLDGGLQLLTSSLSFIFPLYSAYIFGTKVSRSRLFSKVGINLTHNTDFNYGANFGSSIFADIGTVFRFVRLQYGFSFKKVQGTSQAITISYTFFERP